MKLSKKHLGSLVKVAVDPTTTKESWFRRDPFAIPANTPDWYEYIDESHAGVDVYSYFPPGTFGTVVEIANPFPRVTFNYARVLFPKVVYEDEDNQFLQFPTSYEQSAGAYWISGDFLEIFEPE